MEDETTLAAIHRITTEIDQVKDDLKRSKETLADVTNDEPLSAVITTLEQQLKTARTRLKIELEGNPDYTKIKDDMDELRFKLKDQQEILSHHLLQYERENENTRQLPLPDRKRAKQIIIKAKLATKDEPYQERLDFRKEGSE